MTLNSSSDLPDVPDTPRDSRESSIKIPELDFFAAGEEEEEEYSTVIRPRKGDKAEEFICRLEARLHEVRTANSSNMAELLHVYSKGATLCARRQIEEKFVVRNLEIGKKAHAAIVTLEKASAYLKEKGLLSARSPGGSADMREAVLDSDLEYQAILLKHARAEARSELYGVRKEQFERAFYAVKTAVPENHLGNRYKPEIGVNPRGI